MKRRRIVWIGLVALVSLMVFSAPGISFAGGVAVVLDRMPSDVEAGKPFTVGFSIRSAMRIVYRFPIFRRLCCLPTP
jgi:hypothetical protein